jgi:hypothetical protein
MKRLLLGLSILGFAGLFGCGGRAIDDSGSSDLGPGTPAADAGGRAGESSTSGPLPSHDLGVCEPGFDRVQNPTRPCRWLTDSGMCFDDSERACACICPTNKQSVCVHGFDDRPNAATPIFCI